VSRDEKGTGTLSQRQRTGNWLRQGAGIPREQSIEANKISEGTARESEQKLEGDSSPGSATWRTITIREQLEKVGRTRMGTSAHS
jgi:hypothetical protein